MSFDADELLDRRRLKRRLSLWRGGALVALILLVVGVIELSIGDFPQVFGRPYVARLDVKGLITEDRDLLEAIGDVAEDSQARALIVYIDSPGGTVVGGESLFVALRKVAEHIPVVAVMGTTAASAGYMVAIAADSIFARAGTITGSIGVIFQTADVTELLKKLGVEPTAIKSAPLKAVPSPLEPLSAEGREATQRIVDQVFATFGDMVRERRHLNDAQLAEVADGRIFTGREALGKGLIDAIGGEEEARAWLESQRQVSQSLPVIDIHLPEGGSWLYSMASAAMGKPLFPDSLRLDGLIALWHPFFRL